MLKNTYHTILKQNKKEIFLLFLLLTVSFLPRFLDLGYSHFYGDETKTFYLDKTITADKFLLNQRKGPVQFLIVWLTEKIIGGFDETLTRIPFAFLGLVSVFLFYFIVRKLFGVKAAFVSSLMFSLNGFFIALSRTIQYQSPLIFFGFLSILLVLYMKKPHFSWYLVFSSLALALAFLCHYDAIFFSIPLVFFLVRKFREYKITLVHSLFFLTPLFVLLAVFYVPYVFQGYMTRNTVNYIQRRLDGSSFTKNSSLYTILIYNPFIWGNLLLLFSVFSFLKWKRIVMLNWFLFAFISFQFIFLNPGTHIFHYLIPLFILAGAEISELKGVIGKAITFLAVFILSFQFVYAMKTYVPRFSDGYPWNAEVNNNYHLYLYGFPYNRGWDQIRDYLYAKSGVRTVYTNDNATIAEYYLKKFDITPPGSNFLPQYFVYVENSQEFTYPTVEFMLNYKPERGFVFDGSGAGALLYRLK